MNKGSIASIVLAILVAGLLLKFVIYETGPTIKFSNGIYIFAFAIFVLLFNSRVTEGSTTMTYMLIAMIFFGLSFIDWLTYPYIGTDNFFLTVLGVAVFGIGFVGDRIKGTMQTGVADTGSQGQQTTV